MICTEIWLTQPQYILKDTYNLETPYAYLEGTGGGGLWGFALTDFLRVGSIMLLLFASSRSLKTSLRATLTELLLRFSSSSAFFCCSFHAASSFCIWSSSFFFSASRAFLKLAYISCARLDSFSNSSLSRRSFSAFLCCKRSITSLCFFSASFCCSSTLRFSSSSFRAFSSASYNTIKQKFKFHRALSFDSAKTTQIPP